MISRPLLVAVALAAAVSRGSAQQLSFLNRDPKEIEAWAREDTNDFRRLYYVALAHWKWHHLDKADSLLRLVARMEPRYAEPYLALYYLPYARRSRLSDEDLRDHVPDSWKPAVKEAHDFYERAFRIDPMVSLEILEVVYDIKDPHELEMSVAEYQEYLRYYAWAVDLGLGRYRSARERLARLGQSQYQESKHPERVPTYLLLYRGLAAAHGAQFDSAIVDFRSLLERALKPAKRDEIIHVPLQDNEYRFMLGALQQMAGHADSAIALYQESLEHDLSLATAHTYLAGIYDRSGRAADALLERQRAVDVNGEDPAALFDLAMSLFNSGHVMDAVNHCYKAIGLNSRFSPPYYLLGRAGEALGDQEEARNKYAQFLERAPLRLADLRADAQQRLGKLPQ